MFDSFIGSVTAPEELPAHAYWFFLRGFQLLVCEGGSGYSIPQMKDPGSLDISIERQQYLGYLVAPSKRLHCFSAEVSRSSEAPDGMTFLSLRRLFGRLDPTMLALAGRAVQIVEWDRTHQFCGRCGIPVRTLTFERAKKCPQCGLTSYPRLAPAIIVSIERQAASGTELLLAHNLRSPQGFYSVLAGFVEPGETLEECVRREVWEEVGIEVKNIRYFGSQSWPFPNSLMIAFTAEYASGEIVIEKDELGEAGWFSADALPRVPPPISIARQLIDTFVEKNSNHS
ncbi:MAG: NAD(+) diphosphatase [Candidatus Promineifilaceae bacterium]|nr:NAD(+) diphosphatase [Candidatus Promineifilaceae bacterium]